MHGKGSALLHRDREIRNPRTCRAAEGNQSTRLKDHLENINSSLLMVCLKNPINVYTHVPGQHVYPQLMALSGSWNDLCVTTEQTPSPPSFALFPHKLLLTSSNPIPITASHLPFNVNKSCVAGMAATSTDENSGGKAQPAAGSGKGQENKAQEGGIVGPSRGMGGDTLGTLRAWAQLSPLGRTQNHSGWKRPLTSSSTTLNPAFPIPP